jgi:hypothetical protein
MDPRTQKYAKYNKSLIKAFILGTFPWRFFEADLKIASSKTDRKPMRVKTVKKYSH